MRRAPFLTAFVLAAGLALPALAAEPPLQVRLFQSICLRHEGDLAGAEAEAIAQGLTISTDNRGKTLGEDDMEMVFTPAGAGSFQVMISPAPSDLVEMPGARVTFCAVVDHDSDSTLFAAGQALLGQLALPTPLKDGPSGVMIYYRKSPTGLTQVPDQKAAIRAAVLAGEFRVFDLRSSDGNTMLSLMTGSRGTAE